MIWSTSYHHVTILVQRSWPHSLFTVASVHRRQVLLKLHHHMRSLTSKPPTCPSRLQPVRRAKSCLNLLHLDHMTQMSCLMCNELLYQHMCKLCNIPESSLSSWHMLLTYMYLWTNLLCIHVNTISSPKIVTQLPKSNKDLSTEAKSKFEN
jgi:hypothetical protein